MVRVLVSGDFCPINRIELLAKKGDYSRIFNDFISVLKRSDFNITNLECPLFNGSRTISKTGPSLKADETSVKILKYGNFHLVTLANNHVMDFGIDGLKSTLEICDREKIATVGAGFNLQEARKIYFITLNETRIAILNITENEFSTTHNEEPGANPLNPVLNYYDIKEARNKADYVFVIIHGGHEGYHLPSPRMQETYRFFIDAGADIVVGHHTHCFSGYEKYKEGLIFYSLGNFVFDWKGMRNSDWNYGYAVNFTLLDEKITFEVIPYKQCDKNPGVLLLNNTEKQDFNSKLRKLNNILNNNESLLKEWKAFSKKNWNSSLIHFECFSSRIYKSLRYRNLMPGFLSKRKKLILLNIIRCEAHRDLAMESLKNK